MRQRRFTKKPDSLDIDRYGLLGDAPREVLVFIFLLLLIPALIATALNPSINPPPTEFRLLSAKELYPLALEAAQSEYGNVSLRAISLSVWPMDSTQPLEANYWFLVDSTQELLKVTLAESESTYKITINQPPSRIVIGKTANIQLEEIPFDSPEAFNILNDTAQYLWKYPFISIPLELWLGYSFEITLTPNEVPWSIRYRGGGPPGLEAILAMNLKTDSQRIILEE